MAVSLQTYIDEMEDKPLLETITAIATLFPGLTGSVSPTCKYLITHPGYEGEASLNDLGARFLRCAARCTNEHASFEARLLHHSLDEPFAELYRELYTIAMEGYKNGTMVPEPREDRGCACCRGDPDATILAGFHHGEAFFYEEAEYRAIWGDEPEHGGTYSPGRRCLGASKEQIERAMEREREAQVSSRL